MTSERTYYVVSATYNLSWAALGAIYPLFLMSRGLDLFQINVILAVYLFCNFAFEVPTGAVADIFGRKVSFLLSCAIRAIAFLIYFFVDSFAGFVMAEMIDAVGTTLASGALDAWAVDETRREGSTTPVDRLFARAKTISHAAMIVSGLCGGLIAEHDIAYPWLVGVAGFATTGVVAALAMREHRPAPERIEARPAGWLERLNPLPSLRSQVRGGLDTVMGSRTLRMLCLLTAALAFAHMPVMQYWPAHLSQIGGAGPSTIGWMWAAINVAALIGSASLPQLRQRMSRRSIAICLTLARCAGVVIAAMSMSFGKAAGGLIVFFMGMGASDPLLHAWISDHADSKQRATILSVQGMSFMFGGAVGLLVVGLVARAHGVPAGWAVSAVAFMLAGLLAWSATRDAEADGETLGAERVASEGARLEV